MMSKNKNMHTIQQYTDRFPPLIPSYLYYFAKTNNKTDNFEFINFIINFQNMFFSGLITSLTLAINAAAIMPMKPMKIRFSLKLKGLITNFKSAYSTSPVDKICQIVNTIQLFRPILALWNLLVIVLILLTFWFSISNYFAPPHYPLFT